MGRGNSTFKTKTTFNTRIDPWFIVNADIIVTGIAFAKMAGLMDLGLDVRDRY